jgi:hypothetical protein
MPERLTQSVLMFLCCGAICAGQSIGFYSDLQYDSSSGNAYTYAETSSDYSSQYYYDISVYSQLNVSYDGGPANITCQRYGYGSNGNASASCSSNVGTGTVDLELISTHEVNATYYVYQWDSYCSWDCYYWWDAYQTSLMGAQGTIYQSNQYFAPSGPPAQRTAQQKSAYGYLSRRTSNRPCNFPTGESSSFAMWSPAFPHAGHFIGNLEGPHNFTGRVVAENLSQLQGDTCWYQNSPYSPMYIHPSNYGAWTVGSQSAGDIGLFSTLYNSYGMDTVGFANAEAYHHYRTKMQQSGNQCGIIYGQSMYMDGCGGLSRSYGGMQGLQMSIHGTTGATVQRKTASATKY